MKGPKRENEGGRLKGREGGRKDGGRVRRERKGGEKRGEEKTSKVEG